MDPEVATAYLSPEIVNCRTMDAMSPGKSPQCSSLAKDTIMSHGNRSKGYTVTT